MGLVYRFTVTKPDQLPWETSTVMVRFLLAMGFWVQGFRCFPWMGVNFFLKDGLQVAPSTLQILLYSANIPMVGKPIYGITSDVVPIRGMKRLPYVAIGAGLQALSWFAIFFLPPEFTSVPIVSFCLVMSNFGASFAEVANDALVVEAGKAREISLQSFAWMFGAFGAALGNLIGGLALDWIPPRGIFLIFGIIAAVQLSVTVFMSENWFLPARPSPKKGSTSIGRQISEVLKVVRRPDISHSLIWLAGSFAITPVLFGTMFFYQTRYLNLGSSTIGFSKVVAQVCLMVWSFSYNQWLKDVSPRTMLRFLQGITVVFVLLDLLFVRGFFERIGISSSMYVTFLGGILEAQLIMKVLPFSILMAKLCPPGCEGSLMALVMSTVALSMIVSGYFGVVLASFLGVSGDNFSSLPHAIVIEAICAALPMFWCSWIPAKVEQLKKDMNHLENELINSDKKDK